MFDEPGNLIDKPTYIRPMERFMEELGLDVHGTLLWTTRSRSKPAA